MQFGPGAGPGYILAYDDIGIWKSSTKNLMSNLGPIWWRRAPGIRGITRHFLVNQVRWRVFEYAIGVGPTAVSLIFACQTAWRRLCPFPSDWAIRDDAALSELSGF